MSKIGKLLDSFEKVTEKDGTFWMYYGDIVPADAKAELTMLLAQNESLVTVNDELHDRLAQAEAESESRRLVLLEKADEARREWIRAENAEERERRHTAVLKMYANPNNWKSINGIMSLQTLSNPWADAQVALTEGK